MAETARLLRRALGEPEAAIGSPAQPSVPEDSLEGLRALYRPYIVAGADKAPRERQSELQSRMLDSTRLLGLARRLGSESYSDRDERSLVHMRTETLWSLLLRGVDELRKDPKTKGKAIALWQRVTEGVDRNKFLETFGARWENVPERMETVAGDAISRALGAPPPPIESAPTTEWKTPKAGS
jgi:hypothetical protein